MAAHDKRWPVSLQRMRQILPRHCSAIVRHGHASYSIHKAWMLQESCKVKKHFKAAAAMANDIQPGAVDTLEAGHLQIVWDDLRKRRLQKDYSFGKRHKVRKCIWVLAEALRRYKMKKVYRLVSAVALHHDGVCV